MPEIPNGYAHHSIVMLLGALPDPAMVTFGTEWASGSETLGTLASAVAGAWNTHIRPSMDSDITLVRMDSKGRDSTGTEFVTETAIALNGGRSATESPPWSVNTLVRKATGLAGRHNRGRFYVPGVVSEAEVSQDGDITSVRLAALTTSFFNFLSALDARTPASNMVVLRGSGGISYTPAVVTSLVPQTKIGTQRRRIR